MTDENLDEMIDTLNDPVKMDELTRWLRSIIKIIIWFVRLRRFWGKSQNVEKLKN